MTTPTTTIVDLSLAWTEAPLYNQNAAYCTIQRAMDLEAVIGYVVLQNGALVAEGYAPGHDAEELTEIFSVTKSWTSLIVGLMIEDGLLDLDDTLGEVFGTTSEESLLVDWTNMTHAEEKQSVTLQELLTMRSGLQDENFLDGEIPVVDATDVLTRLVYNAEQRGTFEYIAASHVIARVMTARLPAGQTPGDYAASKQVYEHLGLSSSPDSTNFVWSKEASEDGVEGSAFGIQTNPRHLAKLGQLYLQQGMVNAETRLVSEEWIAASGLNQLEPGERTTLLSADDPFEGYSNLWYVPGNQDEVSDDFKGAATAAGLYGQAVAYFPAHNVTIALLGDGIAGQVFNGPYLLSMVAQLSDLSVPQSCDERGNVVSDDDMNNATDTNVEANEEEEEMHEDDDTHDDHDHDDEEEEKHEDHDDETTHDSHDHASDEEHDRDDEGDEASESSILADDDDDSAGAAASWTMLLRGSVLGGTLLAALLL